MFQQASILSLLVILGASNIPANTEASAALRAAAAPASILGGLKNWKLNAADGDKYVDEVPNLSSYSDPDQFYECNGAACFRAHAGGPTSSGSGNPRTELREMSADGKSKIGWKAADTNVMEWKVKVLQLPSSGKVCFGQVHGTGDYDDVIRVQMEGSPNQKSGTVRMKVMGWVTEDDSRFKGDKFVGEFKLGTEYNMFLTFSNKKVILQVKTGGSMKTLFQSAGDVNSNGNYFKAGAYLQSMQGAKKKSGDYAIVAISYLKVVHGGSNNGAPVIGVSAPAPQASEDESEDSAPAPAPKVVDNKGDNDEDDDDDKNDEDDDDDKNDEDDDDDESS